MNCGCQFDGLAITKWCEVHERERRAAVTAETKACAAVARSRGQRDCDDRGAQDPETGEVPCRREAKGGSCLCADLDDMAHEISTHILQRVPKDT